MGSGQLGINNRHTHNQVSVAKLIVSSPLINIICICGSGFVKCSKKLLLSIDYNKAKEGN